MATKRTTDRSATKAFAGRHVISMREFTVRDITDVLRVAQEMKQGKYPGLFTNRILGSLFFEPSTRTRLSFESAMTRLGGRVITAAEAGVTSATKGETLSDSIRVIARYCDIIAMRHPLEGAARLAASVSPVPVLNGGDGANQHPTQTLLDLFTIQETQHKLRGLTVVMVGDLKYGRTIHSLAQGLSHFGTRMLFVAPPSLQMPQDLLRELKRAGVKYSLHQRLEPVLPKADIVYMTRIQKERFPDPLEYEQVKDSYHITPELLQHAKKTMRLLHPLPRVTEIAPAVDALPAAYYFEQAANGVYVRQALIALTLGLL